MSTTIPNSPATLLKSTSSITPMASAIAERTRALPKAFNFAGSEAFFSTCDSMGEGAAPEFSSGDDAMGRELASDLPFLRLCIIGANAGMSAIKAATHAAKAIQSEVFIAIPSMMPNSYSPDPPVCTIENSEECIFSISN